VSDRYTRQLRLPGFGAEQQRCLGRARVAVIGAGGLGSPVLEYLAAAGVGRQENGGWITVIDPDVVDTSNLHRQVIHTTAGVGMAKAESAAARMRAINPEIDVRPHLGVLTVDSALPILGGHDLVLDGTDNFPTRYLASDACELLDLPLVWGSILAFAGQVSVFVADGGRGVTYRDVHPAPPGPGEVPDCAEAGVLGMLCGVIGSTMALEAVKVLARIGEPLVGRIALFDALTMHWAELPVARDPERAPVTGLEDLTLTCGLPGARLPAPAPSGESRPSGSGKLDEAGVSGAGSDGAGPDVTARASGTPAREPGHVVAAELPALLAAGRRLLDIREDHEVADGMLAGAEHVPAGTLLQEVAGAGELGGAVLYCAAGRRSEAAQAALRARGIEVLSLDGGFAAACAAQVPVVLPER